MIDSRLGKLILQLVLGCGLILGAVFFFKTHSGTLSSLTPNARPDGALKNYQQRMQATEQMGTARSDNIYGRWPAPGGRSHRSRSRWGAVASH